MEDPQENWLQAAVRKLKASGRIKRDKDVADETGYSKESVSNMLSGRSAISDKFKTKFESIYGKFEEKRGDQSTSSAELSAKLILRLEKYADMQDDVIRLLKDENARLRDKLKL